MQAEGGEQIPIRLDGLQLDESRPLQRVIWTVQRLLWAVCALLIVAALAGATGRGGVLADQAVTADGAEATWPRVTRRGAEAQADITFLRDAPDHRLLLPHDMLARFEVETATPRPVAEMATRDGTLLFFAADGQAPHRVTLHLRATHPGLVRTGPVADGAVLQAATLILP